MLTLIFTLLLSTLSIQKDTNTVYNPTTKTFEVTSKTHTSSSKEEVTPYTYKLNGTSYTIYTTTKKSFYIYKISKKTNNPYKYYLPKDVQEQIRKQYEK